MELELLVILLLVLLLPFLVRAVEENLEFFLFAMGLLAALVAGVLQRPLVLHAAREPLAISAAVLVASLLFKWFRERLEEAVARLVERVPLPLFAALLVLLLGLLSSVVTAIVASLVLASLLHAMRLGRASQIRLAVLGCFAIGLGAALTPVGEPLATIAVSRLQQDFWFLFRTLGRYVLPGLLLLAAAAGAATARARAREAGGGEEVPEAPEESYLDVLLRAVKIYLFVVGLSFLGAAYEEVIDRYLLALHPAYLYWINLLSAVLDNATLAAAELSPRMTGLQVESILLGLLVSGGMLVPGNIPNIITASRLRIRMGEWARLAVPVGGALLLGYFLAVFVL
ncbi:MAG: DUF1646 domain-containing protein [Firmicutes bacterium]|nr:DUF1646 domain-containing protein [Bacillota bacterium]